MSRNEQIPGYRGYIPGASHRPNGGKFPKGHGAGA